MKPRTRKYMYIASLAVVIFGMMQLVGCVAGGMPNVKDLPPGVEVVAEQSNPMGSSKTTTKGGPAPAVVTPETLEDELNVCLGRHPDEVVRLCGCLERRTLTDTREFEAYCIDERPDPERPEPQAEEVIIIQQHGDGDRPPVVAPVRSSAQGKGSALATAESAVGSDGWASLSEPCRFALEDVVLNTEPDWMESVLDALPSLARRPVEWTAWLQGANFDEAWVDRDAAHTALAAARGNC